MTKQTEDPGYPRPPFPEQIQPWAGLACRMQPPPGPYWTPLRPSGGQTTDKLVKFGADTPPGRPGQPAEIVAQYVLLASHESSVTTGNVWGSTGGEIGP